MTILIPELLRLIFVHLPPSALSSIRLTNRYFYSLASPFLFAHLSLSALSTRLRHFTLITTHPYYATTVRHLTLQAAVYEPRTRASYAARLALTHPTRPDWLQAGSEFEDDAYEDYCRHERDTALIRRRGHDLAALIAALPRLTNLRILELADDEEACLPGSRNYIVATGVGPSPWRLPYLETAASLPEQSGGVVFSPHLEDEYVKHGLKVLIRALGRTGVRVEEFRIRGVSGMPGAAFTWPEGSDMEDLRRAWRGLRRVSVEVRVETKRDYRVLRQGGLPGLWARAQEELEELRVRVVPAGCRGAWTERLELGCLVGGGGYFWKRLKRVELVGIDCTEVELAAFLRRHAESLREVVLADMFLTKGKWSGLAREMADSLALERFELYWSHGPANRVPWGDGRSVSNHSIEDFVLGRGPDPCAGDGP